MEKLTVTAHMKTPFITGGGYMTFDALLAGILFDQLQDAETVTLICAPKLHEIVAQVDGGDR